MEAEQRRAVALTQRQKGFKPQTLRLLVAHLRVQQRAKLTHRRGDHNLPRRDLAVERAAELRREAHRQQRVAAEGKEIRLNVADPQPSSAANACATAISVSLSGARPEVLPVSSGSGSALRSSLPLALSGSALICSSTTGTICGGNCALSESSSASRSSGKPDSETTYPTSWRASPPVAAARLKTQACATAWATSGSDSIARSISPSSMRWPRIFSWSSLRPRYSTAPMSSQRATSPVRYIRSPGANGSAIKRLAVRSGRPRYPCASWMPVR